MKVFLAEKNLRFDLKSAEVYGEIEYLSDTPLNPFNTQDCMIILKEGLKGFNSTEDYLCMTGNLLIMSMMLAMAYNKFDTFRILIFDARTSNYSERIICHV